MIKILKYPDPFLTKKCEKCTVEDLNKALSLQEEVSNFFQNGKAVGLAAPQIGINKRFFWTFINGKLQLYVNPRILSRKSTMEKSVEGCLSIDGFFVPVYRHKKILVEYRDENFNLKTEELEDFRARVFQHEYDHIMGKLIIHYIKEGNRNE